MKYTLINTTTSADTKVFDVVNNPEEKDKDGNITKEESVTETPTDRFFVSINLTLEVELNLEGTQNPTIQKSIIVESTKNMTGHEIEAQRTKAVEEYINQINK